MPATVKQLQFIESLISERDVSATLRAQIMEICTRPDASPAMGGPVSQVIDQLKAMPRKNAGGQTATARVNPLVAAGIPCARYVIERSEVAIDGHGAFGGQPVIFLEVREFKSTRYMRKLVGAPGSYTRAKVTIAERDALVAALVAVTPRVATRRYSELYSICSVCGSELTDETSRALGLGPVCRGRFDA